MNEEIARLIAENDTRNADMFSDYDPITGVGCYDFDNRVKVCINDITYNVQFVPKECFRYEMFRDVAKCGSVRIYITKILGREVSAAQFDFIEKEIYRIRMREDPEFAIYVTDKIIHKKTGQFVHFKLNYPQRKLLAKFESLRKKGVPIRVVILKARQWGGSTLTQLYMKWVQDFLHPDGWSSVILAQTNGTSKRIKAMYRIAVEKQAGWTIDKPGVKFKMAPFEGSQDDFIVTDGKNEIRNSTISIASFNNFESLRGANFHMAHYSEVSSWIKTPEHDPEAVIAAVSGGILEDPDNMEVFESTGKGMSGFFYDLCQDAMAEDSNSLYSFLFIPFFFIENDRMEVEDKVEFAKWLYEHKDSPENPVGYRESGQFFWRLWNLGASFEAINWYRKTRNKHLSHASMATEAPIDPVDAFKNSGRMVFDQYNVDEMMRLYQRKPKYRANIVLPAQTTKNKSYYKNAKIKIVEEGGCLKVWEEPNNKILNVKNRYLVAVDIGGRSVNSDYSVMTVIDRMGMIESIGGMPRVVARWRGHVRHDILAWMAAALAWWYDGAELVIESNTADRNRNSNTEGDHFGTIIEEIADYYDNLYMRRVGPESVPDKIELKWGFNTNVLTKGWCIDNMVAMVDEALWDEPDSECYKEMRIYERKDDNSTGNIEGKDNHDDVIMSTAIGLYVSMKEMEKPCFIEIRRREKHTEVKTEATI